MTTLLILLLALFIERVLWDGAAYRQHHWFGRYQAFFAQQAHWFTEKPWAAIWLVAPILLLLLVLQGSFLPALGWLFSSIFALCILLFSFGPHELGQDTANYLKTKATGDEEKTQAVAAQFSQPQENLSTDGQVSRGILYGICGRLLGPVFWFILLGPIGAASYRLFSLLAQSQRGQNLTTHLALSSQKIFHWIDWLPARITSLGYAIVGNFDAVFSAWKECQHDDNCRENETLVYNTGQVALGDHLDNGNTLVEASLTLAWRNLTLWVAIVGLLVLFSAL